MCYDLLYIGQYCYFSQQCLGGSICRNGYCQCPSGTTKTGSRCVFSNTTACTATQVGVNGTCYERAPIGASCLFHQQCQGGSECINGTCQCPSNMTKFGNTCIISNTTACGTNQLLINGSCYNYTSIGRPCQFSEQCLGNSSCTSGSCQCANGTHQQEDSCVFDEPINNCTDRQIAINGTCYERAPIGASCLFHQQCQGGSECINGTCQCPSNMTKFGNTCIISNTSSEPINNCTDRQIAINGTCYERSPVGSSCLLDGQCLGNSFCLNGTCQCSRGTVVHDDICVEIGSLSCKADEVYFNGSCHLRVCLGSSIKMKFLALCERKRIKHTFTDFYAKASFDGKSFFLKGLMLRFIKKQVTF